MYVDRSELDRTRVKRGASILLPIIFPIFLAAQYWEVFDMANSGLPSNTINVLVQDQQGIVWAGTNWGLCSFDGSDWSVIQQQEGGLPENNITALAVDSANRLWIGTELNGVAILDDGTWTLLNTDNSPLPDNTINGITHDLRGWAWISTALGLACISDQGWRIYDATPSSYMGFEFFSSHVQDVVVRADSLVCVATVNGGLTYITEDEFIYYTTFNSAFFDNSANDIALDGNGDRWIASAAAGLIRHAGPFDSGPWFNYSTQNSGFPDNTLTSLVIDQQDTKFAGTETGGIIVFPVNGTWSVLNMANSGLPDNRVLSLMFDDEGVLWAGTYDGGVARSGTSTHASNMSARSGMPMVHPTPFDRELHVSWAGRELDHQWQVIDASGRLILEGTISGTGTSTLQLDALAPGTHMLILTNDRERAVVRIMKLE